MSDVRFNDRGHPLRYLNVYEVLVRCPRCDGCAVATFSQLRCAACGLVKDIESSEVYFGSVELRAAGRCFHCGRSLAGTWTKPGVHSKTLPTTCPDCKGVTDLPVVARRPVGIPPAHHRGLPLWLQTPCKREILWAYNSEHLAFLERYVGATLRERVPNRNSSLASRLPAWIKSAKNRDEIVRCLARLRASLTGDVSATS